ncbi:hypothetical protein Dimus_039571 [Dionaea muscipula]
MWIRDKRLRVRIAKYDRMVQHHVAAMDSSRPRDSGRLCGLEQQCKESCPARVEGPSQHMDSSVYVVKHGPSSTPSLPSVRGFSLGNAWLYRSVVATFGNHRNPDAMFESFMKTEGGNVTVRRLGRSKVLITFPHEGNMKTFIDQHTKEESFWFKDVVPWSAALEFDFGREVWLSCYGVPVHAWNVGTFSAIANFWGEVLNIDEDTARCVRYDIGKVKVYTKNAAVINSQMILRVGWRSFKIRVAEEQAVFICNSEFNCMCACHGVEDEQPAEDEQTCSATQNRSNASAFNVVRGCSSGSDDECGRSFIEDSLLGGGDSRCEGVVSRDLGEVEMRGCELDRVESLDGGDLGHARSGGFIMGPDQQSRDVTGRLVGHAGSSLLPHASGPGDLVLSPVTCTMGESSSRARIPVLDGEALRSGLEPAGLVNGISEPVFNPNGINLRVVLNPDDECLNKSCQGPSVDRLERTRRCSGSVNLCDYNGAPVSSEFGIRGMGEKDSMVVAFPGQQRLIGEEEAERGMHGLIQVNQVLDQIDSDNNFGVHRPRKRGRPSKKKTKVLVKVVVKATDKLVSGPLCSEKGRRGEVWDEAEKIWRVGQKLGLVSDEADEEVVKKIAEIVAEDCKGPPPSG